MKNSIFAHRISALLILFAAMALFTGCANNEVVTGCLSGQTYGFWSGLWHGIISPLNLILMIWRDDITVFAPNNNGIWYAFGFVIGSGGWGFFGGHGASKNYRKRG